MEFKLILSVDANKYQDHSVSSQKYATEAIGTELINKIRKEVGRHIPISKFKDDRYYFLNTFEITLNEDLVNKCSIFKDRCVINITVPTNFLDHYSEIVYEVLYFTFFDGPFTWLFSKIMGKKAIKCIPIQNKIYADRFISDWMAAQCPTVIDEDFHNTVSHFKGMKQDVVEALEKAVNKSISKDAIDDIVN